MSTKHHKSKRRVKDAAIRNIEGMSDRIDIMYPKQMPKHKYEQVRTNWPQNTAVMANKNWNINITLQCVSETDRRYNTPFKAIAEQNVI